MPEGTGFDAFRRTIEERLDGRPSRALSLAGIAASLRVAPPLEGPVVNTFRHLLGTPAVSPVRLAISVADGWDDRGELPEAGVVENSADGRFVSHRTAFGLAWLDRAEGTLAALADPERLPAWQRAKPYQLLLSVFLADAGVDLLHAGAVARDGRALLFAGNSGAGKSTLSVAGALGGLDFLSDDCLAVSGLEAHSLYATAALEPEHLARRFGALPGAASEEKTLVDAGAIRVATSARIAAIVLPRVSGGDRVTVRRAAARDALLALGPGSVVRRAVPAAAVLKRVAALAAAVPVWQLEMGPIDGVAAALRRILDNPMEEP